MNTKRISNFLKQLGIAAVVLISSVAAPSSYASSFYSSQDPLPLSAFFVIQLPICVSNLDGYSCDDGTWTQSILPSLGVGDQISLTTLSNNFGFYLGNALSGNISLSLSPNYRIDSTPSQDELIINVMSRSGIISQSDFGSTAFNAISGNDYYVLFSGLMRGGQTYELQVSQVPLPASWLLLFSGLMFFRKFSTIRKH